MQTSGARDPAGWLPTQATVRADVNDRVHELTVENSMREAQFLCECNRRSCPAMVTLTLDAYMTLRRAGGAVLAPGHKAG